MKFKLNPDLLPKLKQGEVYALVHEVKESKQVTSTSFYDEYDYVVNEYNVIEYLDSAEKVADAFNKIAFDQVPKYNVLIVSKIKLNNIVSLED